jgi:hypothetical protein
MNYGRLGLAAIAAWIVDAVYGFIVYGTVLSNEFGRYPGIYRPAQSQGAYMPILFVGILVAMLVASYIYAKGYEGGSGVQEGMRFGVLIGLLVLGYVGIVNYAILNIGRRLAGSLAVAGLVEWTLAGIVIGAVYKPAAAPQVKTRQGAMV